MSLDDEAEKTDFTAEDAAVRMDGVAGDGATIRKTKKQILREVYNLPLVYLSTPTMSKLVGVRTMKQRDPVMYEIDISKTQNTAVVSEDGRAVVTVSCSSRCMLINMALACLVEKFKKSRRSIRKRGAVCAQVQAGDARHSICCNECPVTQEAVS